MICQECQTKSAVIHFTKVLNGQKTEIHLCEQCSYQKGYTSFFSSQQSDVSFHHLLAGLLHAGQSMSGETNNFSQQTQLHCPHCQLTYRQFAKTSRFGCAHCYEAFEEQLQPVLRRVHSGNTNHHGKIPKRVGGNLHLRKELEELKHTMQQHIQEEAFEEAAQVRDRIRSIEKQLSAHRKEE